MPTKWTTVAPGIRFREHPERRHGARRDRYYTLRFYIDGRRLEEGLGWASDGWTLQRAQEQLGEILKAKRTGAAERTLAEKRDKAKTDREAKAAAARAEKTVADLWRKYDDEAIALNKPRTAADKRAMWKRRIEPAIGNRKVKEITADDLAPLLNAVMRRDDDGLVLSGKAQAASLYRLLRHLFGKAVDWRMRSASHGDPLAGIAEPKVGRRERLLEPGEVTAIIRALDQVDVEKPVLDAIRLTLLTGARISEIIDLQWDWVKAARSEIHFPDTKTGFSARPISADALALIESVDRMPGVPYVFRRLAEPTAPLTYNAVERGFRKVREKSGVASFTLHTLRHWFATTTANSINNPKVGMKLTGHRSLAAYMQYVHADDAQAHQLAGQIGELTRQLGTAPSNVRKLPQK